ncbi:MAG: AAA family ATPase [Planctomycetaceae bacterium]|nr:AAA family ATPase [Planctomycetaceae bacterium]
MQTQAADQHVESLQALPSVWRDLHAELDKRIVGQDEVIDQLLAAMFCRGHALLIGVPGLAKTLLVRTLADVAELQFARVQFTPDMMPSDITGTEVVEEDPATGQRNFRFVPGPVFTQLLLADEINRTPPKTQAALLEAMQEHAVTAAGERRALTEPFFVLATQNPIEQEGTYPLPEAQLDRFMFSLNVDYPAFGEEVDVLQRTTTDEQAMLSKVLTADQIIAIQAAVRQISVPDSVAQRIVKIVTATRPGDNGTVGVAQKYVRWGAGPRASQYLALAGKAFAALDGRYNVSHEDVLRAVEPVLRHRVLLNYHAEADNRTVESVIEELVQAVR